MDARAFARFPFVSTTPGLKDSQVGLFRVLLIEYCAGYRAWWCTFTLTLYPEYYQERTSP